MVLLGPHRWTILSGAGAGILRPMFAQVNPAEELPLTVVTDRLIVLGSVLTRVRRLLDLVAGPDTQYLVLQDANFLELGSRRIVAQAANAQVSLSDILFLHSTAQTASSDSMRVPKVPVRGTLLVPPFTIEGTIYLPSEASIRIALDAYTEKFVPVTNAKYSAYGTGEALTTADFLVVNHSRAHVSVAAGVKWSGETAVQAGGSNPW